MKKILLLLLLFAGKAGLAQPPADWQPLFNSRDLSGWDIKIAGRPLNDNYLNTFRVEGDMLRIAYDQYKNFDEKYGHLYYKQELSHYRLRYEYRFTGSQTPGGAAWNVRNSGVMLHSQSAESLALNQHFPVSLEMQLLGGLGTGPRHTGNLCTPGTEVFMNGKLRPEHCTDSDSKTYDGDGWVRAEMIVIGDSVIHHLIEGDTVLTYEKPRIGGGFTNAGITAKNVGQDVVDFWLKRQNEPLKSGYIALQAESHPIDFRRVELLNLVGCTDPKASNYKAYFLKSDNKTCVYRK